MLQRKEQKRKAGAALNTFLAMKFVKLKND